MRAFSVTINGRNLIARFHGESKRLGFYTIRDVEAEDATSAGAAALALVRNSSKLREMAMNGAESPMELVVESVEEIAAVDHAEPTPGFAFYDDAEEPSG